MTKPSVRFSLGRYLILLAVIQFFFSGCAQLDGVFPKFKPQKSTKNSTSSTETVTEQQESFTEENLLLKAKIEQLAQQISELQKQQKVQSDQEQIHRVHFHRLKIIHCWENLKPVSRKHLLS